MKEAYYRTQQGWKSCMFLESGHGAGESFSVVAVPDHPREGLPHATARIAYVPTSDVRLQLSLGQWQWLTAGKDAL